jgi:hypothetical protein
VGNKETLLFPEELRHIKLAFDDIIDLDMPNRMSTNQASKIVTFVGSIKDSVDTLIVSCHAGISRSSAVAATVLYALGEDDWYIWEDYVYRPNAYCYPLVLEAFGADMNLVTEKVMHNRELISILFRMTGQTL